MLEERQIERLGSPKTVRVDVRIIAATHRDLEQRIAGDAFREDLYYRLNVFPIQVPPLRERAEDIPLLVWRFVDEFSKAFGKRIDAISRENMEALQRYPWPGNIRELRNVVERAMIVAVGHAPDHRDAGASLGVGRDHDAASSWWTSRRSTSSACSKAAAGASAASAARPTGSGCGRRHSRRGWPSLGSSGPRRSNAQATITVPRFRQR